LRLKLNFKTKLSSRIKTGSLLQFQVYREKEVIEVSKGQLYSKKTHNIELFEKKLSPL
jgi:hypothetical protein